MNGTPTHSRANCSGWPLLVVLLAAVPLYFSQLNMPLLEPEEIRQAEVARQMLATGQFVVPVLNGQPYLDKPPLLYWLLIGSYRLLGVGDVACRVLMGLCAWLTLVVVGGWLRRVPGAAGLAVWAVVVLALLPEFCYRARMLTMNGLLTLWTTAALACGHLAGLAAPSIVSASLASPSPAPHERQQQYRQQRRRQRQRLGWCALAGLCVGLGVLTKGPVAAVLVGVPLAGCLRLGRGGWLTLGLTALAVAGPWFVVVACREPGFAEYFLLFHNLQRFAAPFDHAKPWWFFLPWLALGTLPWTVAAVGGWRAGGAWPTTNATDAARPWLLAWLAAGWTVLFFSLAGSKRPGYILPALPPLAVALAPGVVLLARRRPLLTQSLAVGVVAVLVCALNIWLPPYHDRFALRQAVRSGLVEATLPTGAARPTGTTRPADAARMEAVPISGAVPVYSYPRRWDSVSFYLQRQDVHRFTSAEVSKLVGELQQVGYAAFVVKTESLAGLLAHFPADLHFEPRWQTGWLTTGIVRSTRLSRAAQHSPEAGQSLAQRVGVPSGQ